MKKLRTVLLAGLLIAALCAPAQAWEFAMTGNFQYTYEMFAQGGQNGFFGPQGVANPALGGGERQLVLPEFLGRRPTP